MAALIGWCYRSADARADPTGFEQIRDHFWGVLTNDQDRIQISLCDFRPFVPRLVELDESALADTLAQDYLSSYVAGLNLFVAELNTLIANSAKSN